jgi:hypothetical protein
LPIYRKNELLKEAGTEQEIEEAAARLAAELAECHHCTMSVFHFAEELKSNLAVQLDAMKTATRMMQAQAGAALALQRLRSTNTHRTHPYVYEGRPPVPKKSKTNVPASGAANGHDAETAHKA